MVAEAATHGAEQYDLLARAQQAVQLVQTNPVRTRALAAEVLSVTAEGRAAAEAEWALGLLARGEQDMPAAVTHLTRAARLAERAAALGTMAEVRTSLALALAHRGRIRAALAELERAAAVQPQPRPGRVEFQRGAVLQFQGRLDEALAAYASAEPLLEQADDLFPLAASYNNRALIHSRRGALAVAEGHLRRAGAVFAELGQHRSVADVGHNVGVVAARRGDVIAALSAFDETDRYLVEHDMHDVVDAVGLLDRSEALLSARLLVEARAVAERAVPELDKRALTAYLAEMQLVLAQIALLDGRLDEARELAGVSAAAFGRQRRASYRAAAEATGVRAAWASGVRTPELLASATRLVGRLEAAGWATAALDARLVAGQLALELGRPRTARAQLAPLAARRGADPAEVRSRVFHARALLHLAGGDRRRADQALRAGMSAVERHREAMGGTELRANASTHAADLAKLGVRLALQDGQPGRVLRWAERWRAGVLGLRPVRPPADEQLAESLAELRQVVHEQRDAGGKDAARLLRRQVALERAVQRLARHSETPQRYRSGPPSIVEIQRALGERALVEFVESDEMLYAVVLTARRQSLVQLAPIAKVTRSATLLRFWLRRLVHRFGSPESLARAAQQADVEAAALDELLLAPLVSTVDRPLVIVPTTVLHALPWALLPSRSGQPTSVAPSAAWWSRAATGGIETTPGTGPGRVVLVAGPDLPEAEPEIADLGRLYRDAVVHTGGDAKVSAVAAALDGADLAHVAAHGTFRADQPLLSALMLADGPITVYDLERLNRAPRCMVLASCDAGLAEIRPGDELMGLSAALLAQGTAALIAPLFPVPDVTTRPTMLALHEAMQAGDSPAAALAKASAPGTGLDRFTAAAFVCLGAV
jgi:tetratricopeptide (TPR) repeat protein